MSYEKNRSCLERITNVYSELKGAEKKVAQYILENPKNIIHFSITELAEVSKASEATVFRLCSKIGYKGYQDLKINLAGSVVEPMDNIYEKIKENDDTYIIMRKIMSSNINSIESTLKINKTEHIDKAIELILNAKKIMFFGMGGSWTIANDAYHKFIRTGINCVASSDSHWQMMFSSMADEGDVIIAFSNSGSNKELVENINLAKRKGINIIAITGNEKSPLAKDSDVHLTAYGNESMFRSEAMESRLTSLMIIDWLYVGTALKRKDETLDNLERIRNGIASKRF
ncbi:MurR/RpiR family transcriptional regulator [Clostridium uliginosum]|uniref:DNA-binding transcriptional regulator, MurR/RpiR family, contains HTH and SIS domains n=1 Tax=Clostridium uliginosum TaxID=119641 RepID=A0A1I1SP12_9CLOT|nr:MurR/RpiR family transcriptional regulator [Clostridium uliginosum]SFD48101.1 DNA-binding transcriptional regulator, MurR/RpiR family, contains HTH and SIS domains [Clostridium uliginosum]